MVGLKYEEVEVRDLLEKPGAATLCAREAQKLFNDLKCAGISMVPLGLVLGSNIL